MMVKTKTTGVQRFTLILADGVADKVEEAMFDLRFWRRVSFGSFVEVAIQDLLAKSPDERKAVLERFGASARRPRTRKPVGVTTQNA
jgi:hypothetical protein